MPINCLNGIGENCNKGILRLLFDPGPPENLQAFGTTSRFSYQGLVAPPPSHAHPLASLPPALCPNLPSEQRRSLTSLCPRAATHLIPCVPPPVTHHRLTFYQVYISVWSVRFMSAGCVSYSGLCPAHLRQCRHIAGAQYTVAVELASLHP